MPLRRPKMITGSVTQNNATDQHRVQINLAEAALRCDDLDPDEQRSALKDALDACDLARRIGE